MMPPHHARALKPEMYRAAIGLGCQGPFHSTLSTSS